MIIIIVGVNFLSILANSCQNDADSLCTSTKEISDNLKLSTKQLMSTRIVLGNEIKHGIFKAAEKKQLVKTVYVDFPDDTPKLEIDRVRELKTLDDMMLLSHQTAAEFHFEKSELTCDSISISEKEAEVALKPMVAECKRYLYAKDFSDNDIEEMLQESNADETLLVTFVLALMEKEQMEGEKLADVFNSYPLLFTTPARAVSVDWSKAGYCAAGAIGLDIFAGLSQSTLKTWSIAAMKKAFKTVAQKVVGPVGVLIFVGDFSWCYFN